VETSPPTGTLKSSSALERLAAPSDMGGSAFLTEATVPAEEARQRLLSFMVHEIRNPLASALWSAEMLARQKLADPRHDRLAQLAARSVRRLRGLLEDLFTLERLPVEASPGHCDLRASVEKAVAPHDIEPGGINATITGPAGIDVGIEPSVVDKLLRASVRRAAHVKEDGPLEIHLEEDAGSALMTIERRGVSLADLDPPPLTTGGSEGGATTFALMVVRVAAQRLGLAFWVEPFDDGVRMCLRFPLKHHAAEH